MVNLFGREAVVRAFADKKTAAFFADKGLWTGDDMSIDDSLLSPGPDLPKVQHSIPEWMGYGSYEDSMRSVREIQPKVPPHGPAGPMDRKALRFKLQFKAKLLSDLPSDGGRVFILSFYTQDGTLSVYESAMRNAGRFSCEFAKRGKFARTDVGFDTGGEPVYYAMGDMHIGNRITVNGHDFDLFDASPGTFKFMETHMDKFPLANPKKARKKMRWCLEHKDTLLGYGKPLTVGAILEIMKESQDMGKITEHEVRLSFSFFLPACC